MNNKLFRLFDTISEEYLPQEFEIGDGDDGYFGERKDESSIRIGECVIEMHTGIFDKNGNKVYENDIISFNHQESEVFFCGGSFCVWVSGGYLELSRILHEFKIVGNTHIKNSVPELNVNSRS